MRSTWRLEINCSEPPTVAPTGHWSPNHDHSSLVVAIDADHESPIASLEDELCRLAGIDAQDGTTLYIGDRPLRTLQMTLAESSLRHGDVISDRPIATPQARQPHGLEAPDTPPPNAPAPGSLAPSGSAAGEAVAAPSMSVVVVAGPDTGAVWSLGAGRFTLGRGTNCDLVLNDPLVSGAHLQLDVGGALASGAQSPCPSRSDEASTSTGCPGEAAHLVTMADAGSTNGTLLEDTPVAGPTCWPEDAFVSVGATVLALRREQPTPTLVNQPGPTAGFPRAVRPPRGASPERLSPPTPSSAPEHDRAGWWRSLTPLLTGVGFAMMTGRWEFLLIVALAPIVFFVDAIRSRRRRARERAETEAADAAAQAAFQSLVDGLRQDEVGRSRRQHAPGGLAVSHLLGRSPRLWERRLAHDDFAQVTVGLAKMPSQLDAGDADPVTGNPTLPLAPVVLDLSQGGTLAVVGDSQRGRGVLRTWLLNLAATHGPDDVRVWLLAEDDTAGQWDFLHWLPHVWQHPSRAGLAVDDRSRHRVVADLRRIVDARREQATGSERPWPLHVFLVDRATAISEDDLSFLFEHGPAVGVHGLVNAADRAPDGCGAVVDLGSGYESSYQSRYQRPISGVIVAETSPAVAASAVRRLAPLRAVRDRDDSAESFDLVEELGWNAPSEVTPEAVRARWAERSPTTAAQVGRTGEAPFHIDLAEHGPHGLIGGMSGSGKTEFLMTWLSSLCLDNHPDDLAIVLVDFKGGVDHELTAQLPHTISLSTNLGLGGFQRTIDLLDAEQRRRQTLLAGVAPNLDAYRVARRSRPELPPLPRLLVIVDEFSELLASEDGRDRLEELVRVTRIGRALGVHLLLVTQNFEGQLPAQVDANAGLRVCLRVMKPSHSRAVLDSGAAADLTEPGTGYARFGGGDLVEFRSARVARAVALPDQPVCAERAAGRPLHLAALAFGAPPRPEPPAAADASHLAHLVASMRTAARAEQHQAGHTPASDLVPWPESLPAEIDFGALVRHELTNLEPGVPRRFPSGVMDEPHVQRQRPFVLDAKDQHVLFLGGPKAATTAAMTTAAVAEALSATADDLHILGVDLDGSGLRPLACLPHAGETIAVRDESHGRRILQHLATEASLRRALISDAGVGAIEELDAAQRPPRLLLLVAGADRLLARSDEGQSPLLEPLRQLLNELPGTGIGVWLGGLPQLADSRIGSAADRRYVFALPGGITPMAYGVAREFEGALGPAGRAVDVGTGRLLQFARLSPNPADAAGVIASLAAGLKRVHWTPRRRPRQFPVVTWPLAASALHGQPPPRGMLAPLLVGVDPTSAEPRWLDAAEDGPVLAVTGPARSGRSSALRMLAETAQQSGAYTIGIAGGRRSLGGQPQPGADDAAFHTVCRPADLLAHVERFLAGGGVEAADSSIAIVLCLDDLQRVDEAAATSLTAAVGLLADACPGRWLLFLGGSSEVISGRSTVRRALPPHRGGLLLMPASALDGGAVGISGRLPEEHRAGGRPGQGVLAIEGEWSPIQMALPEAVHETAFKTVPETVPEAVSETLPETVPETVPERVRSHAAAA